MNRFRNTGLFRMELPVIAFLLFGILIHGAVNLAHAKPLTPSTLTKTEVE